MTSARLFHAKVAFCDDPRPFEWSGDVQSPARAAETATEEGWYCRNCPSDDQVGVKVTDAATGEVFFFDVEVDVIITTSATRVRGDELQRRIAEHEAEGAAASVSAEEANGVPG